MPLLLTPQCVRILAQGNLSVAQQKILWAVAERLHDKVEVLSLTEVAQNVRLARETVVNGMRALLRVGLIVRGARVGLSYQYKLNPAYLRPL